MKRSSTMRIIGLAGAVSLLLLLPALPDVQKPGFTIRSDVRLVLLDVAVKNRAGGFVTGLSKVNFSVTENGRPQAITVFDSADAPVTVGILVDESRSMLPKRADVLRAAETFIQESNPQDEIFVLNFNDRVRRGLPEGVLFSGDIGQLHAALYRGIPEGKTALNDAVVDGLAQLQQGRQDKKSLVVITDGGDNASVHTRRQMVDMVERSIATIYTIGVFEPDDPDRNPGLLKELARISGGVAYLPENTSSLTPVCRAIAKEIRTRYTIGYPAPPENGGGDSLRHIRVRVSTPDHSRVTAYTRSSYRYEESGRAQ